MLNLKTTLADDIHAAVTAAQEAGQLPAVDPLPPIVVEHTAKPEHGDYASPFALSISKAVGKPPLDIAGIIVKHLPAKEYLGKAEVASPGFINIRLNPGWLTARLDNLVKEDLCADITVGDSRRYNFEFISANPTGPLTLGNARTAFSVETLANVLEAAGFTITREYYFNDAGAQVKKLGESVVRRILQTRGDSIDYPEELYQGDYINELGARIAEELAEDNGKEYTAEDLDDTKLLASTGHKAAQILLAEIKKTINDDLKIRFDVWSSERKLRESGAVKEAVEALRKKGVTYIKDGAEFLKTTDFGDSEDRVLVKKDGEYAYIAPDIAYHRDKFERKFDGIFTFVGADHQGHGPKLAAAIQALGYDTSKFHFVVAQWMRFVRDGKPVKLSKRRGNIYTPKELIKEVGYDAARFFMVMHTLTTHMDFDLALAKEKSERNPVYYVQYAYVRLQSILRKAKQEGIITSTGDDIELTSHAPLTHTTEVALMRLLYRFPEVITDIAHNLEVQQLCYYTLEFAKAIHVFYRHVSVIHSPDQATQQGRLQLVLATRKVLGHNLDLLGVSKPDVM